MLHNYHIFIVPKMEIKIPYQNMEGESTLKAKLGKKVNWNCNWGVTKIHVLFNQSYHLSWYITVQN
jgi:hypothetical protein